MLINSTLAQIPRRELTVYPIEHLLSLKDITYCKEKPVNLPEFIDREKVTSESSLSRGVRKNRRQGSADGEGSELVPGRPDQEGQDDFILKGRSGHPGNRRDNVGWQPSNHQEHAEQFINRYPVSKFSQSRSNESQGRIIPGKGVPRRGIVPDVQGASGRPMEHQPALANVVTRQAQGFANFNSKLQAQGGLDAFSMGDIRQAERFVESGQMGLDEYARKVAAGEISRDTSHQERHSNAQGGGFFAEDDGPESGRPWLQSAGGNARGSAVSQGRLVPGYASQRPAAPPPPPPPQVQAPRAVGAAKGPTASATGMDSNAQGLALLQMLIDKKHPSSVPATKQAVPTSAPRHLTQQQINELISMSKRTPAKAQPQMASAKAMQPTHSNSRTGNQAFGKHVSVQSQPVTASVPAPGQTPPHVAALLEQLHRQQLAQQQQQSQGGSTPPPECQQQ